MYAKEYHHVFSSRKEPLLRIKSGDTVITRTVDSSGRDYTGAALSGIGNPLTGPFYIEGAEPGDSISVHLDKLRLNRNWGYSSYRLSPGVLNSGVGRAARTKMNIRRTPSYRAGATSFPGISI